MLIVITGPSGVGKTTVIKSLLKSDHNFIYSTSLTTRNPRPGEIDGVDYRFVNREDFCRWIKEGKFAEWSEVYGEYYGRLREDLENLTSHKDVLVGIDVQGAKKLLDIYPEAVFIFLLPKSEEALESQLRGRKTENEEDIKKRLKSALKEIDQADYFDYKVLNNRIDKTVKEVRYIIELEKNRSLSG
jgi:guanylate kinase